MARTDSAVSSRKRADLALERLAAIIDAHRQQGLDRLPNEAELSEEIGVSRNTLREALAMLEANGEIVRKRRVGTIITKRGGDSARKVPTAAVLSYPLDEIMSIHQFLGSAGRTFSIQSVTVHQERATRELGAELEIPAGADVYRVRRMFALDGRNAFVGEHFIPKKLNGHDVHIEALSDGVSTFLFETENIKVDRVDHVASAFIADRVLGAEFGCQIGAPLLSVNARLATRESTAYPRGKAVSVGRLIMNPELLSVRATARNFG